MAAFRHPLLRSIGLSSQALSRLPISKQHNIHPFRFAIAGRRAFATKPTAQTTSTQEQQIGDHAADSASSKPTGVSGVSRSSSSSAKSSTSSGSSHLDWEENPDYSIEKFAQLPTPSFGFNQHMIINTELREALRLVPWEFQSLPYCFAYGSGVFPQTSKSAHVKPSSATSIHSNAPPAIVKAQGGNPKMIDFIFGVTHSEHFHSLNLKNHPEHYSALGALGSGAVTRVQENWGAGVYYNTYVEVKGMTIKYGVVNIDTLCKDLSEWQTLYIAGRLQKPVKILRDSAKVRLANQVNLVSALRTALLLLPSSFTEQELYGTIAGISYLGDPRMSLPAEDPAKVANIVGNNLPHFRRLYAPLVENLPNVQYKDFKCDNLDWAADENANYRLVQDMDPVKRGNMVRRLPKAFRSKLYFQYQSKYQIPQLEFNKMLEESKDDFQNKVSRQQGGSFEQRIASEPAEDLRNTVRGVIKKTIWWPSTSQSVKGLATAGVSKSWRYMSEKIEKSRAAKLKTPEVVGGEAKSEKQIKP